MPSGRWPIDPTRDEPDTERRALDIFSQGTSVQRLLHGRRTIARNRFDIQRSDVILACYLGTKSVSIGSVGEVFWADAMRKPIVIVREDDNLHNHDMLNDLAGWIFEDLDAAIQQVKRLLRYHV